MGMEDRELYRRILGIEDPWYVASVDLRLQPQQVHVYLAHEDLPSWPCAECAAPSPLYDHQPERQWRHLDTCQYRTILHADPPRSQCPTHGVRVVKLPWAEPSSRRRCRLLGSRGLSRPRDCSRLPTGRSS
jgi:transposase